MNQQLPLFTLPVLAIILLGSGCSTVPQSESVSTQDQAMIPPNQPMIMVEMQESGEASHTQKIPLAAAPTLQAAVERSKANERFDRFHIAVSRLPQHPGLPPQKLVSKYDHRNKQIPFEYDYQLNAGDRIVIVKDPSDTMDDLLGTIVGPMRMAAGREPINRSPF
ncbi:hypothetical protein [Bremerella alba]|uniref:Uncharacterized protein n=1 Tax=Bremerella alba TaxID=980252 RepID=A0A7V8V7T2_9BACT|nr:hypothetical protein [Bremerella alba]MBA2116549.1 hypothetical protein [Bremerella alba]